MNFQITSPSGGSFLVEIYDSSATLVYSATHGNEVFDPGITTAGDYILYYTYAGVTQGACFTIPDCGCPTFQGFDFFTGGDDLTYMKLLFQITSFCPFTIAGAGSDPIPGAGVYYAPVFIEIDSITDMTFEGGDVYSLSYPLLGFTTYTFSTFINGTKLCESDLIVTDGSCEGVSDYTIGTTSVGANRYIRIVTASCAADCNSYTVDYFQSYPIPTVPITGSVPHTVDCGTLPSTLDILVTPEYYTAGGAAFSQFKVKVTNCCGAITEQTVTILGETCDAKRPTLAFLAAGPVIGFFYDPAYPCGGIDCDTLTVTYTQINSGIVGVPDSGTTVIDVCPISTNVPISPNFSFPGSTGIAGTNRARYSVTVTNCCGEVFSFVA